MNIQDMTDAQVIAHSLHLWANIIETGDPSMSRVDAGNAGNAGIVLIDRVLSLEQMQFIQRLRRLAEKTP